MAPAPGCKRSADHGSLTSKRAYDPARKCDPVAVPAKSTNLGVAGQVRDGAFQFMDPLAGRLCGHSRRQRSVTRGSPNPTKLPPWPEPKTGRSAGTDTDPPCDAPPPPHAPDHPSAVAHSDRPSAAGTPEAKPPCSATVSRAQRPACSSSTQHLCFNPWREYPVAQPASIPVGGPCFTLACLTQRRQAAAVHALP